MTVEKTGVETVLAAILQLLDRAQTEKPAIARLADRVAGRFVAAILFLAGAVAAYWWWRGASDWLAITIALLVVTCPCALSLATPAAITAATGRLTREGLLATRGHALEALAKASHFVFDKTGTLTEGRLRLLATHPLGSEGPGEADCLAVAAALERRSEHPIARAILAAAGDEVSRRADGVESVPGEGIHGWIEGKAWWLGRPAFVAGRGPPLTLPPGLAEAETAGHTVVLLADEVVLRCAFVLGDELRPGARLLIARLARLGIRNLLLTGDRAAPAHSIAERVGIEAVEAGLRPADKLARVRAIQGRGGVVAMVGDGINDAPVLAGAQVSIAMGSGTELAAASADMILLSDRLERLADGVQAARRTLRVIRQNLVWALGYNGVAVPAAALGYVEPWMAAIGMSASSLLVVLNALRLTR
jgi:Cu2+-exporting ATPase